MCDITILIAAYNEESCIAKALDSICSQSMLPKMVVVVDDGSTDNTANIAISHPLSLVLDLKVIRKINSGVSAARNAGMKVISTEWVAILDADDQLLPNHIETLDSIIRRNPREIVVFANADRVFLNEKVRFDERNLPDFRDISLAVSRVLNGYGDRAVERIKAFELLLKGSFIFNCSSAFKREVDGNLVLYKESLKYAEDQYLFLSLLLQGGFVYNDCTLSIVSRDGLNVSNKKNGYKNNLYKINAMFMFLNEYSDFLDGREKVMVSGEINDRLDEMLYYLALSDNWLSSLLFYFKNSSRWRWVIVFKAVAKVILSRFFRLGVG